MTDEYVPAFPRVERGDEKAIYCGMSLRDYFAAKAMQGFFASNQDDRILKEAFPAVAVSAYMMADAMLKVRDQ